MLTIDPKDAVPIWRQIEEGVRRLIAQGTLDPGGPVPSVRDLAKDLGVNPATVSRAYQRLTDAGILNVRRGEGTFVADTIPLVRKTRRKEALREGALRYASLAITVGATAPEAVESVEEALQELGTPAPGGRG